MNRTGEGTGRLKIFSFCTGLTAHARVYHGPVPDLALIQGRRLSDQDLLQIRNLLAVHPSWHRTQLSRELCALWGWRNGAGRLKDMACRTLLLKLQSRGLIGLPPRQRASVNGHRNRQPAAQALDESPLSAELAALTPLRIEKVCPGTADAGLLGFLLQRHHYLGHRNGVGENLRYLVRERYGRPVACLVFGSAAWQCQPRDAFIGWTLEERRRRLGWVTNNTRFLILPWVRVPHLASHILGTVTRRLSHDWQEKYGHPIHLVETFVERDRFAGTCYRAAGWRVVGRTTGRGRNGWAAAPRLTRKEVLLQPLGADFRRRLRA